MVILGRLRDADPTADAHAFRALKEGFDPETLFTATRTEQPRWTARIEGQQKKIEKQKKDSCAQHHFQP